MPGESSLASRVDRLEEEMADLVDSIREWRREEATTMAVVLQAIGDSPDEATGRPGSGMRGQLASLVRQDRAKSAARELWVDRAKVFAAICSGAGAVLGILKAMGKL